MGVLISVTTIPAAANAEIFTLFVQRKLHQRRRRLHLGDSAREAGGLPVGRSRRSKPNRQAEGTR